MLGKLDVILKNNLITAMHFYRQKLSTLHREHAFNNQHSRSERRLLLRAVCACELSPGDLFLINLSMSAKKSNSRLSAMLRRYILLFEATA